MSFIVAACVAASIFGLIVLFQWVGAKWWPMNRPQEGATDEQ